MVAAAILGGGALTAGASIYGANRAAGAQTDASNRSIDTQMKMFGISRDALQPFIDAGRGGIGQLTQFLTPGGDNLLSRLTNFLDPNASGGAFNALQRLTTPGANMSETLAQTPGYKFAEDRGLMAVNNSLAARGLGGSAGPAAKGAADYVTGLASNTWQSVVSALQNLFSSGSGALTNAFSSGAGALQNLVNTGAGAAGGLGTTATGAGSSIGGTQVGIGNAQAGASTATGNALGSLGGSISSAALLQRLLGPSAPAAGSGLYPPTVPAGAVPYAGASNPWGGG